LRTAEFVSELLDVPKARVYELVRQNLLPAVRIGARQIRFDEETLQAWIKHGGAVNPGSQTHRHETCSEDS
jgi:excisionase family DNA binding protein